MLKQRGLSSMGDITSTTDEDRSKNVKEDNNDKTIKMSCDYISYFIRQANIAYIEAFNSYSLCWVYDEEYRKDISLSDILLKLNDTLFFRIHRKYIVNFMHIDKYDNEFVWIKEKKLKVSRRRKADFEAAYKNYKLKDFNSNIKVDNVFVQ